LIRSFDASFEGNGKHDWADRHESNRTCSDLLAAYIWRLCSGTSESVTVKYRGDVDLAPFECVDIDRSSLVRRVCYDSGNQYMLIRLEETYYHYCEIDAGTVGALLEAPSMGRFFNAHIRGDGADGPFDCRTHRQPEY
jgi:hypothetical protein